MKSRLAVFSVFAAVCCLLLRLGISACGYLLGDVDFDGRITAVDARITLRYSAGLCELGEKAKKHADINRDGRISAVDSRGILRVAAGIEAENSIPEYSVAADFDGGVLCGNRDAFTFDSEDLQTGTMTPVYIGYTFTGWKVKCDDKTVSGKTLTAAETEELIKSAKCDIKLTACRRPNVLKICFSFKEADSDSSYGSKNYYVNKNGFICANSFEVNYFYDGTDKVYCHCLEYGKAFGKNGLHDFKNFGLKPPAGYVFEGWSLNGKIYGERVNGYTAADFTEEIYGGDCTVCLAASFRPVSYTVKFNPQKCDYGYMEPIEFSYGEAKQLPSVDYIRRGYAFDCWNTKPDGSGQSFYDCEEVANLTESDGKTVTLYARWRKTDS